METKCGDCLCKTCARQRTCWRRSCTTCGFLDFPPVKTCPTNEREVEAEDTERTPDEERVPRELTREEHEYLVMSISERLKDLVQRRSGEMSAEVLGTIETSAEALDAIADMVDMHQWVVQSPHLMPPKVFKQLRGFLEGQIAAEANYISNRVDEVQRKRKCIVQDEDFIRMKIDQIGRSARNINLIVGIWKNTATWAVQK